MFVTRMLFAVLAGGLVVCGAVASAQQAGRRTGATVPRPANTRSAAAAARSDGPDDGQAVTQEVAQLELGLLEEEVKLIRTQLGEVLKTRVDHETSISEVDPKAWRDAQAAYEKARAVYLAKARELSARRRRLGQAAATSKDEAKTSAEGSGGEHKAPGSGSHAEGADAAVGSIDMSAVLKRYDRVRQYERRAGAERDEARARIAKLQAEARATSAPAEQVAALKQQIERETRRFQEEQSRRQARESAGVLGEIQAAIAAVARARGLDCVVKVAPTPPPDAGYNDVVAALNRPVLYANPRIDITEEVLGELNRRFEAAGR